MERLRFRTVLLDPPWQERGGGRVKRGADRHYSLMSLRDIERTARTCELFHLADDAHCWLWVTNTFLPQGLELMRLLGFRYVTNTVWVKMKLARWTFRDDQITLDLAAKYLQLGLGQYQRGAHELLLFGVRGKAMLPATKDRLPSVVFAPRGRHSEKPVVFYSRIELISPAPRLEMFARLPRDGWTSWGSEVS